jgi:DNA (cytosine-5)-methyltransferase 1
VKERNLKLASLFCGCGGTDLGAVGGFTYNGKRYARHPIELVYANDFEPGAADIYDLNFKEKADRRDIRQIQSTEIPEHDILLAGFPCQSFSILAQNPPRLGVKDDRGKLFFEILRIVKHHKPKVIVLENVKGLLSANKGVAFELIKEEFQKIGYCLHVKVLNAKDFGVPQKRERVFIVGFRNNLKVNFDFPNPISGGEVVAIRSFLLPKVGSKYYFSEKAVLGMLRSNKRTNGMMNKGRVQSLNQPCNTLTAHLAKVTLNGTDPVLMSGSKYRRFTPREVARLQSFPDSFELIGSDSRQYKALGNAVPPVLFWHVINCVVRAMIGTKKVYSSTKNIDLTV